MAALDRGLADATIKMLGRWKSDAYTWYIRTPGSLHATLGKRSKGIEQWTRNSGQKIKRHRTMDPPKLN